MQIIFPFVSGGKFFCGGGGIILTFSQSPDTYQIGNALECELSVRFRLRCSRHCVKASQHETGFDAGGLKQVSAWLAGELVDVEINEGMM